MSRWMRMGRLLPKRPEIYEIAQRYVDDYRGENNSNPETNGEYRLLSRLLPKASVAFDVGANVGQWTKRALSINPTLHIHCFEPNSRTYRKLCENDFPPAVVRNNIGLGSSAERRRLYLFDDFPEMDSLYRRQGLEAIGLKPQGREEMIQLTTLDDYCRRQRVDRIDFLKVDVEGHELEVFKGAAGMLARRAIRQIQFEYGGCNIDAGVLLKDLLSFFGDYDYSFYKILPDRLLSVPRYDQRMENFQYQNWLMALRTQEGNPMDDQDRTEDR